MWYILICIIIFLIFGIIAWKLNLDEDETSCIALFLFFIMMIIPATNGINSWEEISTREETLYTISGLDLKTFTDIESKGFFVLGTGGYLSDTQIETSYVFFKNTDLGKELTTVPANRIALRESNNEVPQLKAAYVTERRKANVIDRLWGATEEYITNETKRYVEILIIPENSIKVEYNIGL